MISFRRVIDMSMHIIYFDAVVCELVLECASV
jgi:hypothetical protein